MDLYSPEILSWSLIDTRTTEDTTKILKQEIPERQPDDGLIFHTDRGNEFTGKGFRDVLIKHKMKPSVNRLGYCTDNGHMESYIHSLIAELIRGRKFNSMDDLRYALNSYINHFYKKTIAFRDWLLFANRIRENSSMNLMVSILSGEDHHQKRRFACFWGQLSFIVIRN